MGDITPRLFYWFLRNITSSRIPSYAARGICYLT